MRVAVAQFCLANHVDFDRVEKQFADVNKSLKRATAATVAAYELLAGDLLRRWTTWWGRGYACNAIERAAVRRTRGAAGSGVS